MGISLAVLLWQFFIAYSITQSPRHLRGFVAAGWVVWTIAQVVALPLSVIQFATIIWAYTRRPRKSPSSEGPSVGATDKASEGMGCGSSIVLLGGLALFFAFLSAQQNLELLSAIKREYGAPAATAPQKPPPAHTPVATFANEAERQQYIQLLAEYERQYPVLDPNSPQYQELTAQFVAGRTEEYFKQGFSIPGAFEMAISDTFRRK